MSVNTQKYQKAVPDPVRTAIKTAAKAWAEQDYPEDFRTEARDETGRNVHVHIYHHETFDAGGRTFNVDVTAERDSRETPERRRISLHHGQAYVWSQPGELS